MSISRPAQAAPVSGGRPGLARYDGGMHPAGWTMAIVIMAGGPAACARPPAPAVSDGARLRDACDRGDGDACVDLGIRHDRGAGVAADPVVAAALYRRACDLGNPRGCYDLGVAHHDGAGVARDEARARALFERACDGGYAAACLNLGVAFERSGDPSELTAAAERYARACAADDVEVIRLACFNLALLHANGLGVPRDRARAVAWFTRGCDHDDSKSCTQLALALADGAGVDADPVAAVALLERTCASRHAAACFHLGRFLRAGIGVAADPARATRLIAGACQAGLPAACEAPP